MTLNVCTWNPHRARDIEFRYHLCNVIRRYKIYSIYQKIPQKGEGPLYTFLYDIEYASN